MVNQGLPIIQFLPPSSFSDPFSSDLIVGRFLPLERRRGPRYRGWQLWSAWTSWLLPPSFQPPPLALSLSSSFSSSAAAFHSSLALLPPGPEPNRGGNPAPVPSGPTAPSSSFFSSSIPDFGISSELIHSVTRRAPQSEEEAKKKKFLQNFAGSASGAVPPPGTEAVSGSRTTDARADQAVATDGDGSTTLSRRRPSLQPLSPGEDLFGRPRAPGQASSK